MNSDLCLLSTGLQLLVELNLQHFSIGLIGLMGAIKVPRSACIAKHRAGQQVNCDLHPSAERAELDHCGVHRGFWCERDDEKGKRGRRAYTASKRLYRDDGGAMQDGVAATEEMDLHLILSSLFPSVQTSVDPRRRRYFLHRCLSSPASLLPACLDWMAMPMRQL